MPPRRKPASSRKKKAEVQLKRAVKRGDVPPPEQKKHSQKTKRGPTGRHIGPAPVVESARRLQSAFITLPPAFLEQTKAIASNVLLPRPVPNEAPIFVDPPPGQLSCPKRPKWRFDMSKKEVEHNEEGWFKKWLAETDTAVDQWQNPPKDPIEDTPPDPRSPTYYERNLEVWRQLWRVTEISQIILVLLDSRCPLLHFPPSLAAHLADRKLILVLTKVDIAGPTRAAAWAAYLRARYPDFPLVQVESYAEKALSAVAQGRRHFEPHLPTEFRARLIEALRTVHAEMLQPPERVRDNPERMKAWVPPVKRDIDWEGVLQANTRAGSVVGGAAVPLPRDVPSMTTAAADGAKEGGAEERAEAQEPEFLTIGVIGQPNVGKSSLLNALFGASKVRASKTPGKTKHFQTLFWTADVRLVDCPGLVMPNTVPMEMQVLAGILPISRVSAVPACVHFAARFLPLERVYKLAHPASNEPAVEDKRTWRGGARSSTAAVTAGEEDEKKHAWTAMDVLTAYANAKGWVTAKAGRPDVHRAGNAILRGLAEGRVGWAFWPPGTEVERVIEGDMEGVGVWLPHAEIVDEESLESEEEADDGKEAQEESEEEENEEEEEEEEDEEIQAPGVGRFGALLMEGVGSGDEEEE
ncbi:hypothetical protein BD779DRAFT_1666780 [Infundibulicybe gibba]|nr:hypothetical protein BD779DRAFT_1666780 [Infundibulicybe gibba]